MIAFLGFDLLRPELGLALALLPLVLVSGMLEGLARRRARAALADAGLVGRVAVERSRWKGRMRLTAEVLGIALVVLALLGPTRGFTRRTVEQRSLDIVVCIDTSRSMLAEDVFPSRLERACREVTGLLERLAGDRVSLLAFSGDVREVAPLTRDRRTLKALLDEVTPRENRVGGTNLGAALDRALELFDGRTGAHEAIVVLTDGEDLSGTAAEVATRAGTAGIHVYVVGIGTPEGGKIPVVDARGMPGFLTDEQGAEVVTQLDRGSLESIANLSGGAFLTTSDSATPLEEIYMKRIAQLSGRLSSSGEERVPNDRFQWALMPGLLLLLVGFGLNERRFRASRLRPLGWLLVLGCFGVQNQALAAVQNPEPKTTLDAKTSAESVATPASPKAAAPTKQPRPTLRTALDQALTQLHAADYGNAYLALTEQLGEPSPLAQVDPAQLQAAGVDPALLDDLLNGLTAPDAPDSHAQKAAKPADPAPANPPKAESQTANDEPSCTGAQAAHLWFARAVAAHGMDLTEGAIADFERAAGLTDLPALRRLALGNAGAIALEFAEAKRSEFESNPQALTPGMPGAPTSSAQGQAELDPIQVQRALFREARERLLNALRAEDALPGEAGPVVDPNVRANLELCIRRLRDLDREEQEQQEQQEQDEDNQNPSDEPNESEKGDESEPEESEQEESEDEPDSAGEESEEPQDPSDESTDEQAPEPEEPKEPDSELDPTQNEVDPNSDVEPQAPEEPSEALQAPEELSKEQLARLLDQLQALEERQAELRRYMSKSRRQATDRDW